MYISGGNDRLSCKLFPGTLRGVAMQWMATLPPRSIQTFKDLAGSFVSQFAANKLEWTTLIKNSVKAFQKGLRVGLFSDALARRKPVNMEEIRARAEKHVEMEENQYERRRSERRAERKEVRQTGKTRETSDPCLPGSTSKRNVLPLLPRKELKSYMRFATLPCWSTLRKLRES
ncbi:hypothetical protein CR513_06675, partial [Mucuna pruriens]